MAGNKRIRYLFRSQVEGTEHFTTAKLIGEEQTPAAIGLQNEGAANFTIPGI